MKKIFLTILFIISILSIYIFTDSSISSAAYNDASVNPSKIAASPAVIRTHTLTEGNYLPLPCNISSFPYGYGFGTTGTLDTCWTIVQVVGSNGWNLATAMSYPTMPPYQGPYIAVFPSFSYNGIQSRVQSPIFNFTTLTHPTLSFYMTRDNGYPAPKDSIVVEVSTDNGTSWVYSASYQRYSTNSTPSWELKVVDLTSYAGNTNITVGIRGVSMYGNNIGLDTIVVYQGSSTPTVSTTTPVSTGSYSGISGGTVATGGPLTAEGVCWNTSGNPTLSDPHTSDGTLVGTFVSYITGLNAATLYHVRAYATNSSGTGYGSDLTFTTCSAYTLPYLEGFEGITAGNWPCGWTRTNSTNPQTYTGSLTYNRQPHTGTNYFAFYYSPSGAQWAFTPGLNLQGGSTYSFSMWYVTDGYTGWTTLQAEYGSTPTIAAMSPITGASVSNPTNMSYVQMTGTFTPSSNGIYFIGIDCEHNTVPYYLSIDDIDIEGPLAVTKNDDGIPKSYCLYQNFPNPFNPTTKIKFDIPAPLTLPKGEMRNVQLIVYDILGREVATLVNEKLSPGKYEVEWIGSTYPSGVYFYKLSVTGGTVLFTDTKKLILLK